MALLHHTALFALFGECESYKIKKSLYLGKNELCKSRQVYYTKNYKNLLFSNFAHHIRVGSEYKTDPSSVKPPFIFESERYKVDKYGKDFTILDLLRQ
jgi:hypothetical protein